MTQIFAKRPELMPVGETTEEHNHWQQEEAALVERDRSTTGPKGGLFRGCFKIASAHDRRRLYVRPIRDDEDGVDRCPRCTWEMEDGACRSCGWPSGENADVDADDFMDPDIPEEFWENEDDVNSDYLHGIDNDRYIEAFGRDYQPEYWSEQDDFMTDEDYSRSPSPHHDDTYPAHRLTHYRRQVMPDRGSFYTNTSEGSDVDSFADAEDHSLDGFVVDDEEGGTRLESSPPQSIHWASDDGETDARRDYRAEGFETESDSIEPRATANLPWQESAEDESDEGPMPPSRRRRGQTQISDSISSSEEPLRIRQARPRTHISNLYQNPFSRYGIPRSNPHTLNHSRTIDLDSDSDEPVPASQRTRRRQTRPVIPSEDGSGVESSSGTATVGRFSPGRQSIQIQDRDLIERNNNISALVLDESEGDDNSSQNDQPSQPNSATLEEDAPHGYRPGTAAASDHDSHHSFQEDPGTTRARQGPQHRSGRRDRTHLDLREPRSHGRSPAPDSSRSPASIAHERSAPGSRERRARKEAQRRLKVERDQRRGRTTEP